MSDPLAYLITWTGYGTWLPGDQRGWIKPDTFKIQTPDPGREALAKRQMTEPPCVLDPGQRGIVEETIRAHCEIREWYLYAVNVRMNHVHVVDAASVGPDTVMSQLKSWCTRRLKEHQQQTETLQDVRKKWWTENGSTKWINDETHLANAIRYVLHGQ